MRTLTRPLTSAERLNIENARRKIERGQRAVDDARRELATAILDAFQARGSVTELAEVAGVSRQTIYAILDRLSDVVRPVDPPKQKD